MAAVFDMLRESMQQSTCIQRKTRATMLPKIRKSAHSWPSSTPYLKYSWLVSLGERELINMKMENKKYLLSTFKRAVYFQKKRAGLIFYLIASHYEMVAKEKKT